MGSSSDTPICGHWFVKEGESNDFLEYPGSPLKQCTRCKCVTYVNQHAQKSNWKSHKRHCKLLDDRALSNISQMSQDQCVSCIKGQLRSGGPELYHAIKRLREKIFDSGEGDGHEVAAYELHTIARSLIFTPGDHMLTIASCPHMARFLIGNEEDLLSSKSRVHKHLLGKYNGRPSDEFIEDIEDKTEKEETENAVEQYDVLDDIGGQPSSMSFCYLYFNLIVACAINGNPSTSSVHDGRCYLREGDPREKSPASLLSTAALRRAMELWTDPLVLASCGDAMAPAASLVMTAVQYYKGKGILAQQPLCNKHELVPGLLIDRAAMTCMSELLECAGSSSYSSKLLTVLAESCKADAASFHHDLSVKRRAAFALGIYRFIEEYDPTSRSLWGGEAMEFPCDNVNMLFKAICGMHNPMECILRCPFGKKQLMREKK